MSVEVWMSDGSRIRSDKPIGEVLALVNEGLQKPRMVVSEAGDQAFNPFAVVTVALAGGELP